MAVEQLFNLRVTSEFLSARGPKWFPENLRIFLGTFENPKEITHGWDGLPLATAIERRDQARKEPNTKEVVIFLAE